MKLPFRKDNLVTNEVRLNDKKSTKVNIEPSLIEFDTKVTTNEQQSKTNPDDIARNETTKLADYRNHVVNVMKKSGIPMVIRLEQIISVQDEVRNEITSLLDENKDLMEKILKSDGEVIEDDECLLRTANFYYFQNNLEGSRDLYDRVLKRNPSKMTALNNKGALLDCVGKYDEAVDYFNKALSSVSENVHVLCNKGITLYKNGKYEEALRCFDSVLNLESNYVNAITFKGHALYRLGKNNDALDSYNKAIRLDRKNAEALYNKACLCSLKGDEYGALTSLELAIRLDPTWKAAAREDRDLEHIKNNLQFLELVQSSN